MMRGGHNLCIRLDGTSVPRIICDTMFHLVLCTNYVLDVHATYVFAANFPCALSRSGIQVRCQNSFQTSCDELCSDRRAPDMLDWLDRT